MALASDQVVPPRGHASALSGGRAAVGGSLLRMNLRRSCRPQPEHEAELAACAEALVSAQRHLDRMASAFG